MLMKNSFRRKAKEVVTPIVIAQRRFLNSMKKLVEEIRNWDITRGELLYITWEMSKVRK